MLSINTACAAGRAGRGRRDDPIRRSGRRRTGGSDTLSDVLYAGFTSLESLSPRPAAPYSRDRQGATPRGPRRRAGVSSSTAAIDSRVRSSGVGPRPPVEITRSDRRSASANASRTTSSRSGTAVSRPTRTPARVRSRARSPAFVSRVSPVVTTPPTTFDTSSSIATGRSLFSKRRGSVSVSASHWRRVAATSSNSPVDACICTISCSGTISSARSGTASGRPCLSESGGRTARNTPTGLNRHYDDFIEEQQFIWSPR